MTFDEKRNAVNRAIDKYFEDKTDDPELLIQLLQTDAIYTISELIIKENISDKLVRIISILQEK